MAAANAEGSASTKYGEREVVITRVFDAPPALVFKAWTDPKHLKTWWGPKGFTNPVCEVDARVGGAWRIVMRAPDGREYPCGGVYREIVEPERLVFTNIAVDGDGNPIIDGLTTVIFAEAGGKTKLTLQTRGTALVAYAAAYLQGMEAGWTQSLERLSEFVAKELPDTSDREIVITRVFDAPREMVWNAWTDPKQVVQWWGPKGFSTTIHEMDVRPGGTWWHTMHGPDGTDYPNKSIFIEVVKPERISYSHGGGRKGAPGANFVATWTFEAIGNKTKLTIRSVFASAEERDLIVKTYNAIEGGHQTLGRLAGYLGETPVVIERTFNAPVAMVWKALTDINHMKQWYMPLLDSFKPEVGFETQFSIRKGDIEYIHLWKVTEVVPEKKIAYTWRYGGFPGDSTVTFELFAEADKTKLRLTHTGLETFLPENNPDLARGNFLQGWTALGSSLEKFLEAQRGS